MITYVLELFKDYIFAPLALALCATIVVLVKKYADKMTRRSTVKDELESLQVSSSIRATIIDELDKIVQAAVATNMSVVEEMKSSGRKLSDAESAEMNRAARILIMNSMPTEIKDPEGRIMSIIGGEEALDALIMILIEKHVYEYKPQSQQNIAKIHEILSYGNEVQDEEGLPQEPVEDEVYQEETYTLQNGELVEEKDIPVVDVPSAIQAGAIQSMVKTIGISIPDVYRRDGLG